MKPGARRLLSVAAGQLGTRENPSGSNRVKYNTVYYRSEVHGDSFPWCVVFQWWCFREAGMGKSIFPKSASVAAVTDWYRRRNRFGSKPKVGALVIFHFSEGNHIGLVTKVFSNGLIQTIEGNTDRRGGRTGGRVMVKTRTGSGIFGYCYPEYAAADPRQRSLHLGPPRRRVKKPTTKSGTNPKPGTKPVTGTKPGTKSGTGTKPAPRRPDIIDLRDVTLRADRLRVVRARRA